MILSAESVSAVCFEQVYNDYENKSSCIYDGAMTYPGMYVWYGTVQYDDDDADEQNDEKRGLLGNRKAVGSISKSETFI